MAERCGQCGSGRVVPKAVVWDQGQYSNGTLQAYVYANPGAVFFKGAAYATLYARICADCGHTSLFAEGAEALYDAYVRGRSAGEGPAAEVRPPGRDRGSAGDGCLSCGEPIPAGAEKCPACGWSWGGTDAPA